MVRIFCTWLKNINLQKNINLRSSAQPQQDKNKENYTQASHNESTRKNNL